MVSAYFHPKEDPFGTQPMPQTSHLDWAPGYHLWAPLSLQMTP